MTQSTDTEWQEAFKQQIIGQTTQVNHDDEFHAYIQNTLKRHQPDPQVEEKVYSLMFNAMRQASLLLNK